MSEFSFIDSLPHDLMEVLTDAAITNGLPRILSALLAGCREIGSTMRNGQYSHEEVGTTNTSGDDQLHVDLATEEVIFQKLKASGKLHIYIYQGSNNPFTIYNIYIILSYHIVS